MSANGSSSLEKGAGSAAAAGARSKLRIVHCFRSPVGGLFRHVRDLAEAQAQAGHLVGILCDSTTGGEYEERLFAGIGKSLALGLHRMPIKRHVGPGDVAAAARSFAAIRRLKPDVLHGHGAKGGAYARVFGTLLRLGGPRPGRFYTAHGGSLHYDERALSGKAVFALERLMGRLSDHIFFVSEFERQAFRIKVGEPGCRSSLVYNGLRSDEFVPVAPEPDAADFLFIGMMRDLKGPDIFLDGLALAERELGRPLRAVMVGDGDDRARYQELARRLGLAERVSFRMPMPAREAFALARTVIVPSRAEAMPYIVLEALAAGIPMIASAVGGIPEIFGAGSPALVPPDPARLGERMAFAIREAAAFRAAMPQAEGLRRRFGADTMARHIEDAYLGVLRQASWPSRP